MQLGGGGGGGQQSQYMINEQPVEAASPISSRPPASAATGNSDEFMRLASGGDDGAGGGEEEGDRSGGGAGGGVVASGGNRWPRQETLALLKIRSDMDSTFRDAPVKGPLWEDVSRKLAELGYKRSAKKCREKFENVHKYYKRTKEGRVGRQDGKSYKFFSELEAFHTSPSAATAMDAVPVSAVIPMPVSSVRNIPPTSTTSLPIPTMPTSSSMPGPVAVPVSAVPPPMPTAAPPITTNTLIATALEFDFSSNSSSSSQGFNDDDEEEDELGGEPSDTAGTSRKRKRRSGGGGGSSTTQMMMEFLEGLMKQVMQKQESLQQRFLEAIEKREQDRMSREEAWKRQETLRLTREHELMSQERAIAASRDEAIITFLQKITGQTIQLPTPPPTTTTTVTIPTLPPLTKPAVAPVVPPPASIRVPTPPLNQPPPSQQQQPQPPPISSEQMPLQETGGSGSGEPASSRWPKEEVLALINLRSGLDSRYQDVGPKGPLWEEISAGMLRMGYKRNAKRCKEKWENINKYYKKVKESSKKRPEDAKTCPYFHQLDALHRSKMLSGGSSSFSHSQNRPEEEDISDATLIRQPIDHQSENKTGDTVGEGNGGAAKKPGNTVRELKEGQGMQLQQHHKGQSLLVDDSFKGVQFQWRE